MVDGTICDQKLIYFSNHSIRYRCLIGTFWSVVTFCGCPCNTMSEFPFFISCLPNFQLHLPLFFGSVGSRIGGISPGEQFRIRRKLRAGAGVSYCVFCDVWGRKHGFRCLSSLLLTDILCQHSEFHNASFKFYFKLFLFNRALLAASTAATLEVAMCSAVTSPHLILMWEKSEKWLHLAPPRYTTSLHHLVTLTHFVRQWWTAFEWRW